MTMLQRLFRPALRSSIRTKNATPAPARRLHVISNQKPRATHKNNNFFTSKPNTTCRARWFIQPKTKPTKSHSRKTLQASGDSVITGVIIVSLFAIWPAEIDNPSSPGDNDDDMHPITRYTNHLILMHQEFAEKRDFSPATAARYWELGREALSNHFGGAAVTEVAVRDNDEREALMDHLKVGSEGRVFSARDDESAEGRPFILVQVLGRPAHFEMREEEHMQWDAHLEAFATLCGRQGASRGLLVVSGGDAGYRVYYDGRRLWHVQIMEFMDELIEQEALASLAQSTV